MQFVNIFQIVYLPSILNFNEQRGHGSGVWNKHQYMRLDSEEVLRLSFYFGLISIAQHIPGVSEKSMVQQIINILGMVKHSNVIFSDLISTSFVQQSVKFQLHISNIAKVMNLRRVMDETGLRVSYQTTNLYTSVFYHPGPF